MFFFFVHYPLILFVDDETATCQSDMISQEKKMVALALEFGKIEPQIATATDTVSINDSVTKPQRRW